MVPDDIASVAGERTCLEEPAPNAVWMGQVFQKIPIIERVHLSSSGFLRNHIGGLLLL